MNTPNYYKGTYYKMEAHEVIEDFCGDNYNLGVALAYLMRCGKKPNNDISKDIQKANDLLNYKINNQQNQNEEQSELDRINEKLFTYNGTSTY